MIKKNKEIVFKDGIPHKNKFIQALLFLRFPLLIPGVKQIVKIHLKHCRDIDFIFGFRYFYGNIYAKSVFLGDTFILDYAPVYIGENTKISFENMLITSTHDKDNFKLVKARPIVIGKNVWITTRCIVLGGVTIGDNSIIGAGSVVTGDIPANCFAAGNPAKVVKYF